MNWKKPVTRLALLLTGLTTASCVLAEGLAYGISNTFNAVATLPGQDPELPGHHDSDEIEGVLLALHARYPERTEVEGIGLTHEGRPILAMRIANDIADPGFDRPDVLFIGGTHGCEPASTETVLRFLVFLVVAWDELGELVEDRNVWVVPILNPDGLDYFYAGGPLWWRKNRRPVVGARWRSTGVDLNRNFPLAWGHEGGGSSPNPDSAMYRGPEPISEPESRALHDLVMRRDVRVCFTFHTFGNQYLYPISYEPRDPEDIQFYQAFCTAASELNGYAYGNPASGMIPVHGRLPNGDFDDWMQGDRGLADRSIYKTPSLSMTVEVAETLGATYFEQPDVNLFFLETVVPNLCAIEIADDPYGAIDSLAERMDRIDARVYEILNGMDGGLQAVHDLLLPGGWLHDEGRLAYQKMAKARQRAREWAETTETKR